MMSERKLTDRDLDVLRDLDEYQRGLPHCGARPLDLGGHSGSHHSATLAKLVRRGMVEQQRRVVSGYGRASYRYFLTDRGRSQVHREE